MRKTIIAIAALFVCAASFAQTYPYQDKALTPEQRAEDLLSRLTLEEKAALCQNTSPAIPRLGIKGYNWWNEALHGVARNGSATVFPQAIGMAAAFDRELLYDVFTIASDEARAKNNEARKKGDVKIYEGLTFWTPNINIFRDPRWGRGMETYGEDPYLTGELGVQVVKGLQGDDESAIRKTHACAKHYAVHSGLESNRHRFDAQCSERDLRETYLPAFKDLVVKGNVQEVMTAYNRFRGYPCAMSDYLVNTILRGEWNYQGMIVSDCWAVPDFYQKGHHEVLETGAQAAAAAVRTGVDVECGQTYVNIPEAVETGLLDIADLDRNVRRLLIQRFKLGEMDAESPWDNLDLSIVESEEHKAVSLQMAHETIVLLQNKDNVLPLQTSQKIALIGPNAADAEMMWGNYNGIPTTSVSLLDAMQARVPELVSFRACGIVDEEYAPKPDPRSPFYGLSIEMNQAALEAIAQRFAIGINEVRKYAEREMKMAENFRPALDEEAVLAQLEGIDVVVVAGGISPNFEGEEMRVQVPGFSGGDRTSIELPDVQRRLLKALHEAGKKVVFVNFSGSAMGLVPELETCDAIVQAWYPGQMGGTAVADVLFGDYNPSGKLPVTFYRSTEDLPEVEDYNMEGHTYRYFRGTPLFEFGYGQSYTTFKMKRARVRNGKLIVRVKNTGKMDGDQVVQLYVKNLNDPQGPNKTLRGFARVHVRAGRTAKVVIPITDETFLWWSEADQNMVPVSGKYELQYGFSSADNQLKTKTYTYSK